MDVQQETKKIEDSGVPSANDAIEGEPEPGFDIAPEADSLPIFPPYRQRYVPDGLLLSLEVPREQPTFGELLNLIANAWRGREDIEVQTGMDGAIRDGSGAPIGLWLISKD